MPRGGYSPDRRGLLRDSGRVGASLTGGTPNEFKKNPTASVSRDTVTVSKSRLMRVIRSSRNTLEHLDNLELESLQRGCTPDSSPNRTEVARETSKGLAKVTLTIRMNRPK